MTVATPKVPFLARKVPLSYGEAADRITAYVYGNVLVLAALVPLSNDSVRDGSAAFIVAGTAVTTFLAHLFAESVGEQVRDPGETVSFYKLLRGSVPVLSAGAFPVLILVLGWRDVLSPNYVSWISEGWIVVRLALTSFIIARVQNRPASFLTLISSIGLAVVALIVVALKIFLTH